MKSPSAQFDRSSGTSEEGATQGACSSDVPLTSAQSPRLVIRGESFPEQGEGEPPTGIVGKNAVSRFAAHTDWLNCAFPLTDTRESINTFFRSFLAIAGERFGPLEELGRGLHGWRRSYGFGKTGGSFAIGGQSGRALVSLPGAACSLIPLESWQPLVQLLRDRYSARITRWDGAVDDFAGVHSVDWAVNQYLEGGFSTGGNRPSCKQIGNWLQPDCTGRSFYIGRRRNGKVMRVYEKGKQLGNSASTWVRWELELHNKDRVVPWEVVLNPGPYVASAYACTHWISVEMCRIRTSEATAEIGYDAMTFYARQGYGQLIDVMMEVEQGDAFAVIEKLRRPGMPKRLAVPLPPESPEGNGKVFGEGE